MVVPGRCGPSVSVWASVLVRQLRRPPSINLRLGRAAMGFAACSALRRRWAGGVAQVWQRAACNLSASAGVAESLVPVWRRGRQGTQPSPWDLAVHTLSICGLRLWLQDQLMGFAAAGSAFSSLDCTDAYGGVGLPGGICLRVMTPALFWGPL